MKTLLGITLFSFMSCWTVSKHDSVLSLTSNYCYVSRKFNHNHFVWNLQRLWILAIHRISLLKF